MILPRALGAACLTLVAFAMCPDDPVAVEQFAPYRQSRADGAYVDWYDGQAGILGRAIKYQDLKLKPYFLEAQQMALTEGRARLLDYLKTLRIDGARRIGDDTALLSRVRAVLEAAPPGKSEVILPFGLTVPIRLPLYGGKGLLGAVLNPPDAAPEPAAQEPAAAPADTAGTPAAPGDQAAAPAGPTGLVVDASKVPALATALLPKIVDEAGRVVHGLETLEPRDAIQHGVAGYALRVEERQARPVKTTRQGERPLRVAAIGAAGPGNTWAVVSVADADLILKAESGSPFLKNGRVLILAPPGGPRAAPAIPAPAPRKPASKPAPEKDL